MALTPADVEEKTFGTALRGYDLDEVDDFLDEVVGTIRDLQDQLAAAKAAKPVAAGPTVVADESAVGRALIAAQTAADQLIADAEGESQRLIEEAKKEADTWVSEKEAKKAEAEAEMAELSDHVSNVRTQLAMLATAVADRLDEMDQTIDGTTPAETEGTVVETADADLGTETFDVAEGGDETVGAHEGEEGGAHDGDDPDNGSMSEELESDAEIDSVEEDDDSQDESFGR
ncbi:MAG: DivIVA domain-containing protein [Acidimicrobiia bacterium]